MSGQGASARLLAATAADAVATENAAHRQLCVFECPRVCACVYYVVLRFTPRICSSMCFARLIVRARAFAQTDFWPAVLDLRTNRRNNHHTTTIHKPKHIEPPPHHQANQPGTLKYRTRTRPNARTLAHEMHEFASRDAMRDHLWATSPQECSLSLPLTLMLCGSDAVVENRQWTDDVVPRAVARARRA